MKKKHSKELIRFCRRNLLTMSQAVGDEKISGSLYLNELTSIPEGFNPYVCMDLYLNKLTSIPKGFSPIVGRDLHLDSLTSMPRCFSPVVDRCLFLENLTSIPKCFNPVVGGSIYFNKLSLIPKGFNPTVGNSLYFSNLTSVPEWFNPLICGFLHTKNEIKNLGKDNNFISWGDGKYISVDGVFTEVIGHRGNVWRVKKLYSDKVFYLVSDGNGKYAHGNTLKEAKHDLLYKLDVRNKDDFADLTLESEISFEDAIICYRVITGACSLGVNEYIEERIGERFETESIKNIIKRTEGEYGNKEFAEFFIK